MQRTNSGGASFPIPQSETLYVASQGQYPRGAHIDAYDIQTGAKTSQDPCCIDMGVAVSPDRRHLIWETGGGSGLEAWNWASASFATHGGTARPGNSGSYAVSGDWSKVFQRVQDPDLGTEFILENDLGGCAEFICNFRFPPYHGPLGVMATNQNGSTIYIAVDTSGKSELQTIDVASGRVTSSVALPHTTNSLFLDAATNQVYAPACCVREIFVVDLNTNTLRGHIFEERGQISAFAISSDGYSLYTVYGTWLTKYLVTATGSSYRARQYRLPYPVGYNTQIAVSATGQYAFVGSINNVNGLPVPVIQLDTTTGRVVRSFPLPLRNYRFTSLAER